MASGRHNKQTNQSLAVAGSHLRSGRLGRSGDATDWRTRKISVASCARSFWIGLLMSAWRSGALNAAGNSSVSPLFIGDITAASPGFSPEIGKWPMARTPTRQSGSQLAVTVRATRAQTDEQMLSSWLDSLASAHTRRNFEITARRFLAELPMGLRAATVEDVRDALAKVTVGLAETSARQYIPRAKSLVRYAHELGYTPFNAGQSRRHPG